MARDNQVKGKTAGNQNETRQKMDHSDRAAESGRSGGNASGTGKVSGETKEEISGGNQGGGGATRHTDR
jgi:hypothetical protein